MFLFDNCFITLIENRLLFEDYKTNKWSNWFIDSIKTYAGSKIAKLINGIIILSPVIFTLVALVNIYLLCERKKLNYSRLLKLISNNIINVIEIIVLFLILAILSHFANKTINENFHR